MTTPLSPEGYAATGGSVCPQCGSPDLTHGPLCLDGSGAVMPVACLTCQARWNAIFELMGYEDARDA